MYIIYFPTIRARWKNLKNVDKISECSVGMLIKRPLLFLSSILHHKYPFESFWIEKLYAIFKHQKFFITETFFYRQKKPSNSKHMRHIFFKLKTVTLEELSKLILEKLQYNVYENKICMIELHRFAGYCICCECEQFLWKPKKKQLCYNYIFQTKIQ